ncbi:MAG: hypothetical protein ACRCX8_20240 [Sarcina sp.]
MKIVVSSVDLGFVKVVTEDSVKIVDRILKDYTIIEVRRLNHHIRLTDSHSKEAFIKAKRDDLDKLFTIFFTKLEDSVMANE